MAGGLTDLNVSNPIIAPDLRYCVEWRRWLWTKPVAWVIGDPSRFSGKRVLDLGCRYGKMSCYFASLGAQVHGVDVKQECLPLARQEATRWGVESRVRFSSYTGDMSELPQGEYDFVFSKSVLVVMGSLEVALGNISRLLRSDGEYLAVENLRGGRLLTAARRHWVHRRWQDFNRQFDGLDRTSVDKFAEYFDQVSFKTFLHLIVAIRAERSLLKSGIDNVSLNRMEGSSYQGAKKETVY